MRSPFVVAEAETSSGNSNVTSVSKRTPLLEAPEHLSATGRHKRPAPHSVCKSRSVRLLNQIRQVSPRGRRLRDDKPPAADGSSIQKSRRISPSAISGGRRWLSCRQPACLQPRQLRHGTDRRTDRQTDGSRYRLMPPRAGA